MHVREYIKATHKILTSESTREISRTLDALKQYLSVRGLLKLYPTILRGVLEMERRKNKTSATRITVAHKKDLSEYQDKIDKHLRDLKKTQVSSEIHIDQNCIGGYAIETKEMYIDQTFKTKLLHAYRRIIT